MSTDLTSYIPKKILVLQQRQIGDVILATPVFSHLKNRFPHAQVDLFTEKKCEPLLRYNPNIDNFRILEKEKLNFFTQIRYFKSILKNDYDLIIDIQQLPRCQILSLLGRKSIRVTFPPRHSYRRKLYSHIVEPDDVYTSGWKVSLLKPFGIQYNGEAPRIYLQSEEKELAHKTLVQAGWNPNNPLITMDTTQKQVKRSWAYFAQLIPMLLDAIPTVQILLLYAPDEESIVQKYHEINPERILLPETVPEIRISAACMSLAKMHVGNDSSPRHMAVALDIPSVITPVDHAPEHAWTYIPPKNAKGELHGSRHLEVRAKTPCDICSGPVCECMDRVSAKEVLEKVLDVFENPFWENISK